jgi:hypothetical protein
LEEFADRHFPNQLLLPFAVDDAADVAEGDGGKAAPICNELFHLCLVIPVAFLDLHLLLPVPHHIVNLE